MAQRKLDVVLDSVKRLQRMGATANLVNLLQKQHPADLAQLFSELPDKDRQSAFSLLVERNSRLAMEGLERARSRGGRRAARRSLGRRDRQAGPGAAVGRRGGPHRLPARGARRRRARADAEASRRRGRRRAARVRRADRRPHHEPEGLRALRGHDRGRGDHRAAGIARRRGGLLSLRDRRAPAPRRRRLAAPAAARLAADAAQADHDDGHLSASASTRTRRKSRAWSRPTTCSRSRSSTRRTSWSA